MKKLILKLCLFFLCTFSSVLVLGAEYLLSWPGQTNDQKELGKNVLCIGEGRSGCTIPVRNDQIGNSDYFDIDNLLSKQTLVDGMVHGLQLTSLSSANEVRFDLFTEISATQAKQAVSCRAIWEQLSSVLQNSSSNATTGFMNRIWHVNCLGNSAKIFGSQFIMNDFDQLQPLASDDRRETDPTTNESNILFKYKYVSDVYFEPAQITEAPIQGAQYKIRFLVDEYKRRDGSRTVNTVVPISVGDIPIFIPYSYTEQYPWVKTRTIHNAYLNGNDQQTHQVQLNQNHVGYNEAKVLLGCSSFKEAKNLSSFNERGSSLGGTSGAKYSYNFSGEALNNVMKQCTDQAISIFTSKIGFWDRNDRNSNPEDVRVSFGTTIVYSADKTLPFKNYANTLLDAITKAQSEYFYVWKKAYDLVKAAVGTNGTLDSSIKTLKETMTTNFKTFIVSALTKKIITKEQFNSVKMLKKEEIIKIIDTNASELSENKKEVYIIWLREDKASFNNKNLLEQLKLVPNTAGEESNENILTYFEKMRDSKLAFLNQVKAAVNEFISLTEKMSLRNNAKIIEIRKNLKNSLKDPTI
ncbi:MAG: hypothetical protein HQK51_07915 [Oligoflexia bacterium]|nr:hypothetical protein [Oligoflexia bacterium]